MATGPWKMSNSIRCQGNEVVVHTYWDVFKTTKPGWYQLPVPVGMQRGIPTSERSLTVSCKSALRKSRESVLQQTQQSSSRFLSKRPRFLFIPKLVRRWLDSWFPETQDPNAIHLVNEPATSLDHYSAGKRSTRQPGWLSPRIMLSDKESRLGRPHTPGSMPVMFWEGAVVWKDISGCWGLEAEVT